MQVLRTGSKASELPTSRLSLYKEAPTADIMLSELESFALARLRSTFCHRSPDAGLWFASFLAKMRVRERADEPWLTIAVVLRELDAAKLRGIKGPSLTAHIKKMLDAEFPNTPGKAGEVKRKDEFSHFILRAAFADTYVLHRDSAHDSVVG